MRLALLPAGRLSIAWDPWRRLAQWWRRETGPDLSLPDDLAPPGMAPAHGHGVAALHAAATAQPSQPEARAAWADRLWGPGFALPGGEAEILRLAFLLPLSPATTLLLVGRDAGGAAACLAAQRGAWVAAHQHDCWMADRAEPLLKPFGRRAALAAWDPAAPAFRPRFHHHALALEPMLAGTAPDAFFPALATGLKPGAQVVLVETVLAGDPASPGLARWLALDERPTLPPPREVVEEALQRAGFTLHVTESIGGRHTAAATDAWMRLLAELREGGRPGAAVEAAALVAEAERWLLHHRLLRGGSIAVLRWHATLRG
ncbi:hypothetical protein [Paracraurococcus ruber]|uniref:Uncharacterized protein n=1 Tax=Paracraurococcus ruber TaxID=77675 RepID=A0ABS1CWT5_9PROT|nr:hypothetical protein [Paracraurococcus ruber]MBK1658843.1 hypothetical protein [Paracraurococcus ruber]TDG32743.1 hypothetical protein E2C05_05860 [Paracraurococcus ruber]